MRLRPLALIAFIAVAAPVWLAPVAAAEKKAAAPAVVIRVNSIDSLISDALFVAEAAGKGKEAKNVEGILKTFIGPKGLEGIDTTKRIGVYGRLAAKLLEDGEIVVMVPIIDEKPLLERLTTVGAKFEKGKDDVYKIDIPMVPVPGFFRFANGYLYATVRDAKPLAKDRLLAPAVVLPAGKSSTLEVLLDLDAIPADLKEVVIGQASLRLGEAKGDKKPGETDAEHKFRVAALDELANHVKAIINDGKQMTLNVEIDRKTTEAVASLRFTAKSGSKLAASLAEAGKGKTIFGHMASPNAAASFSVFASLPSALRKPYEAFLDEKLKQITDSAVPNQRASVEKLIKAITPTLKALEVNAGLELRGPGEKGPYTFLTGIAVKEGDEIDKAVRAIYATVPAEVRTFLVLDAEKVGAVNVHRFTFPPGALDADAKRILGEHPIYFAIRRDVVLVAGGEKGLDALKDTLGRPAKDAKIIHLDFSVARVAGLDKDPLSGKVAEMVFGKDPKGDKVRITLEGGKALELRASAKLKLVEFALRLDEEKKKGAK